MTAAKRIGILTSGGDCAGLNAVMRAAVHRAVLGYGWQANEDGTQSVVLDVDLALKTAEGKLVASEEKFLSTDIRSLSQNLETFLTFDATLTDFAAGAYVLEFTVRDRASGKSGTFSLPVALGGSAG